MAGLRSPLVVFALLFFSACSTQDWSDSRAVSPPTSAQSWINQLSCQAGVPLVVEQETLKGINKPRVLVLWMCNPTRQRGMPAGSYTCPDETRGSQSYTGPTRISLIDLSTGRIINTVQFVSDWPDGRFDLPIAIAPGYYYHVKTPLVNGEGKPQILWLQEYNGDGEPLEFATWSSETCSDVGVSVYGYSKRQDRVIVYPFHIVTHQNGKREVQDQLGSDDFPVDKPIRPGYWKYLLEFNNNLAYDTEIRYNAEQERFEGTVNVGPAHWVKPPATSESHKARP
jgi:hypothetical protein